MFWGLSPALDLQEEYFNVHSDSGNEINIIILGGSDSRHVLKTIANVYKHKEKQLNIHVFEECSELLARQLILLYIATTSSKDLGLQDKTRTFMELYGNSLMRYSSCRHMVKTADVLIKFITNLSLVDKHWPLVSLEKIKYRERDYIEMLLKFWKEGFSNKFDICSLWDRRVRNHLGVRYDSRNGVFDWDYSMRFRDVGGKAVNIQEYTHFRSTGVAFTWLETEVSRPNYTFAAGVLVNGETFIHRGYLGDIVTGPYVAYGLDCEDKEMMKASHGTHHKRSTDLTERNLMRMFYEIEMKHSFDAQTIVGDTEHDLGVVTVALNNAIISEEMDPGDHFTNKQIPSFINLDQIKVHFHSFSNLNCYVNNESHLEKFHVMFLSNRLSKTLQSSIMTLMVPGGVVLIEGKKFIFDLKRDDVDLFVKDMEKIEVEWNCKLLSKVVPFKDSWAKFRVDKNT